MRTIFTSFLVISFMLILPELSARDLLISSAASLPGPPADTIPPDNNALLASITWPEIPITMRNRRGWRDDTIPGFDSQIFEYVVDLPHTIDKVPVLTAGTDDPNAFAVITRAERLVGSIEERTITIHVTAEDSVTTQTYTVLLNRLKAPENVQLLELDPFLSQLVYRDQFHNNFIEVCNAGNTSIWLGDYMFVFDTVASPEEAILSNADTSDFDTRYKKYIPGFRWQSESNWKIKPGIADPDYNTKDILEPGEVFVMTYIRDTSISGYPWFASEASDIDFARNPWNESIDSLSCLTGQPDSATLFIFRIENDSIQNGFKPANDPADFTLVETFGSGKEPWIIGGVPVEEASSYIRKPSISKGNTAISGSFGTSPDDSEWLLTTQSSLIDSGVPYPDNLLLVAEGIGQHDFDELTYHLSTVTSIIYNISEGYSLKEEILGVVSGTTADLFIPNIIKADPGQTLTLTASNNGRILTGNDNLKNGDTLTVVSADGLNVTKYLLDVTSSGLSNIAYLTSFIYQIQVGVTTGSISGFEFGTRLSAILNNITIPAGATLIVLNAAGESVPPYYENTDGNYQPTRVGNDIFFEVVAEDNVTTILYELLPGYNSSNVTLVSKTYIIDYINSTIASLPDGIKVHAFLDALETAPGTVINIIDNQGNIRAESEIQYHDRLEITSADGTVSHEYFLNFANEPYFEQDRIPNIIPGTDVDICPGDSALVYVSGTFFEPYTITWNGGISDSVKFLPDTTSEYIVTVTNDYGTDSDTVTVFIRSIPSSNVPDTTICYGEPVTLTATGGVTYDWDQGVQNGVPFIPETTGDYIVSITNAYGCMNNDTVTVTVNPAPFVNGGPDLEVCPGDEVILSASADAPFSWDNGVTDGIAFVPAVTTDYHVTATNVLGCSTTDTVTVTVYPPPAINAGTDQQICSGDSVTLTASGVSGYIWDGGVQDGIPFAPVESQTYYVSVTDGFGCNNIDSVLVTVHPLPQIDGGADQEICLGDPVILTASGEPGYTWSGGISDGAEFVPEVTSEYIVDVTDANGCANADTVIIIVLPLPGMEAGPDQSVCRGSEIILNGSSADAFTWAEGVKNGVGFIPAETMYYHATATSTDGCSFTDSVLITILDLPTIDAGPDQQVCEGLSVTLTASSNGTVTWDGGVTDGVTFLPASTAAYHATATSVDGCVNTDTVSVTVLPLPDANAGADQLICRGESAILNASGGTTFVWSNGISNGGSVSPEVTTTYTVFVTDDAGCIGIDEVVIMVNKADTSVTAEGLTLTANANDATYQWVDCSGFLDISGATSKSFTPQEDGSYAVRVTQNGCTEISGCYTVQGVSFEDPLSKFGLRYYPNPATEQLIVETGTLNNKGDLVLTLFDIAGKALLQIRSADEVINLDLSAYASGLYFIELEGSGRKVTFKAVKE